MAFKIKIKLGKAHHCKYFDKFEYLHFEAKIEHCNIQMTANQMTVNPLQFSL
jgi:hypothetical protein